MTTPTALHQFLSLLGLSQPEITLYLTLAQKGTLTTLELSRTSGVKRTQVYRLLESLKAKGLIKEIIEEHRHLNQAVDANELTHLVGAKKHEQKLLETLFPQVKALLLAQVGLNQTETKVLFYRGREGLRQLVWHTLRAEKEVIGYTYRRIEEYVGREFMMDWRDSFIRKHLVFRDVYSEEYLKSKAELPWQDHFPATHFQSRFISQKTLTVNLQMDIYNDVVSQYNWHEGEVFGVEIYNRKIAAFQRQLFEIVWEKGK